MSGQHRFGENQPESHRVHSDELTELLERLHASDNSHKDTLDSSHHAIRDICEATGYSEQAVLAMLQQIRRERREEEIAREILKLEEPLYSVERPSTEIKADPFLNYEWARRQPINSALEEIEKREQMRLKKVRRRAALQPNFSDKIAVWILSSMAGLFFLFLTIWLIRGGR